MSKQSSPRSAIMPNRPQASRAVIPAEAKISNEQTSFSAQRLLELYDRVADAPNAVERLRKFVLDLAVRGKLVEQDPADEPASKLLERIAEEKECLVEAGKIKRQKPSEHIEPFDEPFNLPISWVWVRLADILTKLTDGTHYSPPNGPAGDFLYITAKNIKSDGVFLDNATYVSREVHEQIYSRCNPEPGDILYIKDGATTGVLTINNIEEPFSMLSSVALLKLPSTLFNRLIVEFLRSPFFYGQMRSFMKGAAITRVTLKRMGPALLPLPPLAEQNRIVAKVDELMALLDRLESTRTQRESTRDRLTTASLTRLSATDTTDKEFRAHARFALDNLDHLTCRPDQINTLRQTILNLAVRGKLVEQVPDDEPASQLLYRLRAIQKAASYKGGLRKRKPIHSMRRDELLFKIPDSWQLPSFDDLFIIASGVTKGGRVTADSAVELPYLRVANVQRGHLNLNVMKKIIVRQSDLERYRLRTGDILMTEGGDWDKLGRAAIWRNEIPDCIHQNHIFRVRLPSNEILPEWVVIYINSGLGRRFFEDASKQTTNLASINMTQLRGCPLPLPPLNEQYRIVAKVDSLMALCGWMNGALTSTENARLQLLEQTTQGALQRNPLTQGTA